MPHETEAAAPSRSAPHAPADVSLRALLGLAWPIVLARATQSVIGFTDALLVSPLGEDALAAVTTGSLNTIAAVIFPMGTLFILQSFAAQLRGRGCFAGSPDLADAGQEDSKLGALAEAVAPHLDAAMVQRDEALHDGEPDAEPAYSEAA